MSLDIRLFTTKTTIHIIKLVFLYVILQKKSRFREDGVFAMLNICLSVSVC